MATDRNPSISREQSARFVAPPAQSGLESLASGIAGVAEGAVEFRQQKLTTQLERELLNEQDQALAELNKKLDASDEQETGMPLAPGEEMSLREFSQKMTDLQTSANQGTSSMTQLKIRQEQILRDYMNRYPALRPRFQQAAQGVLGYSPIGARVRAAEAAEQAAGGAGMPPILTMMINQAVQAGVDPTLYVRNPDEFWAQAQHLLHLRQQTANQDMVIKSLQGQASLAQITRQPEWASFTAGLSELVWREQLMPTIRNFYNDLEITPGMSLQQRQAKIEGAMNDGRYRDIQLGLMEDKETNIVRMYERYQGSGIGTTSINGVTIPVMSLADFRESIKPILDQYDWAIANINDPKAMEAMEMFNKARSQRIISGMPDGLITLAEVGKLFGGDNTFSQILTQGELGNAAATIVSDFVTRQFGGTGSGGETSPTVAPPGETETEPGNAKPQDGDPTSRLFTIDEVRNLTGAAVDDADEAIRQLVQRTGHQWMEDFEASGDPVYAIGAWTLAKEYGNMVLYAATNNGTLPSIEADNAVLNMVSDPRFAGVAKTGSSGTSNREASAQGLIAALGARAGEEFDALIGNLQDTLSAEAGEAAQRTGRPGATGTGNLRGTVSNYVDYDLDTDGYTITFKVKDRIPSYQQANIERVVERLNNSTSLAEQESLVRLTMAGAHIRGVNSPTAYRIMMDAVLGVGR